MNPILEQIQRIGIVPVVVLEDAKMAEGLAKALCEGHLPCAEITFRTQAAEESIRLIREKYPEILLGAGTVLTTEQVDRAAAAGARFIVSPGLNPRIVKYCVEKNILMIPGCSNAGDIEQALELGLETVKFFPAEQAGGLEMIKALSAPYTGIRFMPTGGINAKNVREYLSFDKVIACGGSWMVKKEFIQNGEFDTIAKLADEAARIVSKCRKK